jgi:triosephosphate isomerase (TIM)
MSKLLVANWKLNPQTEREAVALARAEDAKGVVICPPFPFLSVVKKAVRHASLGAQDVFWDGPPAGGGAYTGGVSPVMLKKLGVEYVIIGHSERRALGETDAAVNKKVKAALAVGLKVILCVGEPAPVRKKGIAAAQKFVAKQLKADLAGIKLTSKRANELTIAYEPIWAISTSRSAKSRDNADTPESVVAMAAFIKNLLHSTFYILHSSILYGGSVTSRNVRDFLYYKELNGALVGGASLQAGEFKKIIERTKGL